VAAGFSLSLGGGGGGIRAAGSWQLQPIAERGASRPEGAAVERKPLSGCTLPTTGTSESHANIRCIWAHCCPKQDRVVRMPAEGKGLESRKSGFSG
jgi:hypothetical protein